MSTFMSTQLLMLLCVLTWWCGLTFTVVPWTGRFRVQTKCAGNGGEFIAELFHVIRDYWPRVPAAVPHCIPILMLQNVTALLCFGDQAKHIDTGPKFTKQESTLSNNILTYKHICCPTILYTHIHKIQLRQIFLLYKPKGCKTKCNQIWLL